LFSSRRCRNKGQDTRCWEKYGRRSFASSYCGEALEAPLFPSPGFILDPNSYTLCTYYFNSYIVEQNIKYWCVLQLRSSGEKILIGNLQSKKLTGKTSER
jgi:hypothetical protein